MPEQSSNKFTELNSDTHIYNTPATVMTDAVNATLTTEGENQLILQNLKGTDHVATITEGFQPLGVATNREIAYIISGKFDEEGNFLEGEIGTYPSPDWSSLHEFSLSSITNQNYLPLIDEYSPLMNFISFTDLSNYLTDLTDKTENDILNDDSYYKFAFRTNKFQFKIDQLIEIELQESYDGSVNIIFTDGINVLRLINSRFILSSDAKSAALANRRQQKDTNTYSDTRFLNTRVLKVSDVIPTLTFDGVFSGGSLNGGNYKIYFAYSDVDGFVSDIVEESRTVSVGFETYGAKPTDNTGKYMQFTLSNLDYKFNFVKIYFSYSAGDSVGVSTIKLIDNEYVLPSTGDLIIKIYGNEETIDVDKTKLNLDYSSINTVKSITQHDDRLILANITNSAKDFDLFKDISSLIPILETDKPLEIKGLNKGYADPKNIYENLGYWAGETYELGIVYVLSNGRGTTPVFPLRGSDNLTYKGNHTSYIGANKYNNSLINNNYIKDSNTHEALINTTSGFVESINNNISNIKENRLGVYRTSFEKDLLIKQFPNENSLQNTFYYLSNNEVYIIESKTALGFENNLDNNIFEATFKLTYKISNYDFAYTLTSFKTIIKISFITEKFNDVTSLWEQVDIKITDWSKGNGTTVTNFNISAVNSNKEYEENFTIKTNEIDILATDMYRFKISIENLKSTYQWFPPYPYDFNIHYPPSFNLSQSYDNYITNNINFKTKITSDFVVTTDLENDANNFLTSSLLNHSIPSSSNEFKNADSTMVRYLVAKYDILTHPESPYRSFLDENVEGFFFVRKERKKDCEFQGYITNTAVISKDIYVNNNAGQSYYIDRSLMPKWDDNIYSYMNDTYRYLLDPIGKPDYKDGKIIPAPGRMIELALTPRKQSGTVYLDNETPFRSKVLTKSDKLIFNSKTLSVQGRISLNTIDALYLPEIDANYAFYTPDMIVDPMYAASFFNNTQRGIYVTNTAIKMNSFLANTFTNYLNSYGAIQANVLNPTTFKTNFEKPNWVGGIEDKTLKYFIYVKEEQEVYGDLQFSSISSRNQYRAGSSVPYDSNDGGLAVISLSGESSEISNRTSFLATDGIKYGDYIGLKIKATDGILSFDNTQTIKKYSGIVQLSENLKNDFDIVTNFPGRVNSTINSPIVLPMKYFIRFQTEGIRFGVLTNIYNSPSGVIPYDNDVLKNKYINTDESPYFPISERIRLKDVINNFPAYKTLASGDCFVCFTYKRAWYHLGVQGVPTATDPTLYTQFNRDAGLIDRGMVFALVCEANHNTALRTLQVKDLIESGIYGKERSFYPLENIESTRGSNQLESKGYNYGYDIFNSEKEYIALNDTAPAFNLNYDTRILLSAPAVSGSFTNGYNDFSGINFKDYAKHLGSITKIISQRSVLYCVQANGVSIVPMNQRTMISKEQGGVYIDDGALLASKLNILSSEYGSDQQFSVIKTDTTIYGCSYSKNKIWRIEEGPSFKIISDFKIQKILNKFKKRCNSYLNKDYKPFVKASFDRRTNIVVFTYYVIYKNTYLTDSIQGNKISQSFSKEIGSVYYNELLGKWVSTISWDPMFMFNLGNDLYSFNSRKDKNKIWKHFSDNKIAENNKSNKIIPTCNFYGEQEKFEFEFVVVANPLIQKILNNLIIVCNREFPNRVILSVDSDVDYETFELNDPSYIELMRQRHEPFKYSFEIINNFEIEINNISIEEAERLIGATFVFENKIYKFVSYSLNGQNVRISIQSPNINSLPQNLQINSINFGLIKQNMEYIEDHLYIEIGKNNNASLVRDKAIKVRLIYEGMNYITIQQIVSIFDYSFN